VREIRTRLAPLRSLLLLLRAGRRLVGGPLRDEEWHDLSEHVAATLKSCFKTMEFVILAASSFLHGGSHGRTAFA